jgi:hypothetical protein
LYHNLSLKQTATMTTQNNTPKKFDLSAIMKNAWNYVRTLALTISEALKKAWAEAKTGIGAMAVVAPTTYSVTIKTRTLGDLTITGKIGVGEYAEIFNSKGEKIGVIPCRDSSSMPHEPASEHKITAIINKQRGVIMIPAETLEVMEGRVRVAKVKQGTGKFLPNGDEIMWTESYYHKGSDSYARRTGYRRPNGTEYTTNSISH